MHVTQTYLGTHGDGGLFVYYLFEEYAVDQMVLTERVQNALDDIGADYMKEVDLFRPNARFAGDIAAEVRELWPVWEHCREGLPGFLVTYKPLVQVDPQGDTVIFFSIRDRDEAEALEVVRRIREIALDHVRRPSADRSPPDREPALFARFLDALEIKPGFLGVSIDLKRLAGR